MVAVDPDFLKDPFVVQDDHLVAGAGRVQLGSERGILCFEKREPGSRSSDVWGSRTCVPGGVASCSGVESLASAGRSRLTARAASPPAGQATQDRATIPSAVPSRREALAIRVAG